MTAEGIGPEPGEAKALERRYAEWQRTAWHNQDHSIRREAVLRMRAIRKEIGDEKAQEIRRSLLS